MVAWGQGEHLVECFRRKHFGQEAGREVVPNFFLQCEQKAEGNTVLEALETVLLICSILYFFDFA